jgi:hypothetical protein
MNTLDIKQLLPELKKQVTLLAEDLLKRVSADAKINDGLKEAFQQIEKGGRTAQAYEVWLDDYLDQVAVAWVLSCVFVRFLEDNGLIDECWLAGDGDRRQLAEDAHTLFFRDHPRESDREYFQYVFKEVGKIPAAKALFAEGNTPLWAVAPSGDAAMNLLRFWREMNAESGKLKRSFEVENGDTRFLGDLYQELSEKAKKKYALLQTPVFVEEFILDRTLTPALADFGLEKIRMIDPACGSGHFLLGGFSRLFDLRSKPAFTTGNAEKDAQLALDGVWGVDINPFAVAIARLRLIVAAMQACDIKQLKKAPGWNIHLASGDSLLFGSRPSFDGERVGIAQQLSLFELPAIYAVEDRKTLQQILSQSYQVVVGNPPYIMVKDKAQNEAYRKLYSTCYRKYSLAAPFAQRFWELALPQDETKEGCGYIGQITANSFMKREFGKKLIEEFFPTVDLTHVIDTSGAFIPGHGTPTVILFGRARRPVEGKVRAVFGVKGEPSTPENPAEGLVWRSILKLIDTANLQDEFTSSADVLRETFAQHPWSIGGGGVSDVMEVLCENAPSKLKNEIDVVGIFGMTNADDVFWADHQSFLRFKVESHCIRQLQLGTELRDWSGFVSNFSIFPYSEEPALISIEAIPGVYKWLWPSKTILGNRATFGKGTYFSEKLPWWKWHQVALDRLKPPLSIAFPAIASHNHFVLDQGGKVFNRSAPIIKLRAEATEDEHLGLLGVLNSSVACFWIKQTTQIKTQTTGMDSHEWQLRRDIDTSKVKEIPICESKPLQLSRRIFDSTKDLSALEASRLLEGLPKGGDVRTLLETAEVKSASLREQLIALQEELDWECYQHYGLLHEDLRYEGVDLPEVSLGQRAFEIVMARQMAKGELRTGWFDRHGSTPITELPTHWPAAYRRTVERRIGTIESDKAIGLIEKPEYKRRWIPESWKERERAALKSWLLNRLETPMYLKGTNANPELTTTAHMADVASADAEFLQVAGLLRGRPDFDIAALLSDLVEGEAIPFLPILRYTLSGLRKREVWERTWDLQRQQDAGKDMGELPVPPEYTNSSGKVDFVKSDFWRLRGSLDVPKERWVSYPHCSTDNDPTLVVGWAGWNHLQQATALVAYYDARKREGWDAKRLTPLLAGLDQLLPWIHQWHPEVDPEYGETAGQSFQHMLESDAHELGLTVEAIRNWTPPAKQPNTIKKPTKKAKKQS